MILILRHDLIHGMI